MKFLLILFILQLTLTVSAQQFERLKDEPVADFIKRIAKTEKLSHPIIETNEWNPILKSIIYFVPDIHGEEENNVIGYLLIPSTARMYKQVLIDTFYQEGAIANIEAVFFANADKDKERELIILTRWQQHHKGAQIYGELYGTFIYDNPTPKIEQKRLRLFKSLSHKLDGGFDGATGDKSVKAKFKTAASIRIALKGMGY